MSPKLSVIVAVYNIEPFIKKCLKSLVTQTLEDIEILVINDGSPDNSQQIIDRFAADYPTKVRSFVKPNGGLSDARNYGLERARGEYVAFVDGDDYVLPDMYEEMYLKAKVTDSDIVVCGYVSVDQSTRKRTYFKQGTEAEFGLSLADNPNYLRMVASYAWNKIFRRELFESTGIRFPVGKLFEDIPTVYSIMAVANKIEKVNRGFYIYRRFRSGAITHTYSPRNLEMLEMLELLNDFYIEHGLFDAFQAELQFLNFRHVFNRFVELPRYDGIAIKQRWISDSERHMARYFPEWRRDPMIQKRWGGQWQFKYFRNQALRHVYALTPRFGHEASTRISALRWKLRSATSNWRRIQLGYARDLPRLPVDPSVALFESYWGRQVSDSPFYLMRDLVSRGTHTVYVTATDVEKTGDFLKSYGLDAKPLQVGSREYYRVLATAGYLVNNVTFPPHFIKRPEQVYLNTWHGTPLKTLGKSMPYGLQDVANTQRNFLKTDLMLFNNEYTRDHILRDYMLDGLYTGSVVLEGSPRNAIFFDQLRSSQLRDELGLAGKRVYMYMPTWRGKSTRQVDKGYLEELKGHLSTIDSALGDDCVVMLKLHQLVSSGLDVDEFRHVVLAPTHLETYDLLNVADCLITDYSSVLFDFAATRREILLFAYDLEEYLRDRDLYMPLEELPFPVFTTACQLAEHMARDDEFVADARYQQFVQRFAPLDGPDAAKCVNDAALSRLARLEPDPPPSSRAVDVVFLPYLDKKGRAKLSRLLRSGYARDDVVFVFSLGRSSKAAGRYLYSLYKDQGLQLNFVISSGRMVLTGVQSVALRLYRRFGWRSTLVDSAYLAERDRLFGRMRVRSAMDVSKYRKYRELAEVMNRYADTPESDVRVENPGQIGPVVEASDRSDLAVVSLGEGVHEHDSASGSNPGL